MKELAYENHSSAEKHDEAVWEKAVWQTSHVEEG